MSATGDAALQHPALSHRHGGLCRLAPLGPSAEGTYSKGQKNDFKVAEAIAEAVQRPTMRFVAIKTVEQLDCRPCIASASGSCHSAPG